MPDITMPEVEQEVVQVAIDDTFSCSTVTETETVTEEDGEAVDLSQPEDVEEEEDDAVETAPEPISKKIDNKDIFKTKKKDPVMKLSKIIKPNETPIKKRVMTDEHKARLKKGRETSLANRRAAAQAKAQAKVQDVPEQILEPVPVRAAEPIVQQQGLSKDDVLDLVAKASQKSLENYELLRKKRKENKARANKEEDERQAIRKTIQSATTSGMNPNNPWGNCY